MEGKRVLILTKGGEIFIFCWTPGDEYMLLEAMMEQAKDPGTNLDCFDAAVLMLQTGLNVEQVNDILAATS